MPPTSVHTPPGADRARISQFSSAMAWPSATRSAERTAECTNAITRVLIYSLHRWALCYPGFAVGTRPAFQLVVHKLEPGDRQSLQCGILRAGLQIAHPHSSSRPL